LWEEQIEQAEEAITAVKSTGCCFLVKPAEYSVEVSKLAQSGCIT
jgi:hypothetical protein